MRSWTRMDGSILVSADSAVYDDVYPAVHVPCLVRLYACTDEVLDKHGWFHTGKSVSTVV